MGLATLLFQSFAMGVGALLVGLSPLFFSSIASGRRLKIVSQVGMGLLIGAALTIIIPGVSTIYGSVLVPVPAPGTPNVAGHNLAARATLKLEQRTTTPLSFPLMGVLDKHEHDDDDDNKDEDDDDEHTGFSSNPTKAIGMSLLSGFLLMLVIEQTTHGSDHDHKARSSPSPSQPHSRAPSPPYRSPSSAPLLGQASTSPNPTIPSRPPTWHSLSHRPSSDHMIGQESFKEGHDSEEDPSVDRGREGDEQDSDADPAGSSGPKPHHHPPFDKGFSATLGLVIHSAADGIALGASARSESSLGLVVFLAILIHKIPASLGLCTTLMAAGTPRDLIRQRVSLFAAAAPVGALLTYLVVHLVAGGINHHNLMWWTGVALLFSGGTFLFVAVTQDLNPAPSEDPTLNLSKPLRLGLLVAGMLLPSILSSLAGHHH